MISRCPGQDSRNLKTEELNCPGCGASVEMFSDEIKRRCPNCAGQIVRHRLPCCVDWCKAAKECLGVYKLTRKQGG